MSKIKKNKFLKIFFNWIILILVAVIAGYAFVTFLFQTVTVVGPSMSPTLKDGQVVVVNKLEYRIHKIKRYDLVVYQKVDSDSYFDIKRVIGLPGETVKISNGKIIINGKQLEDCPIKDNINNPGIAAAEVSLGKNEYFVLGDNVNNSEDSRYTNIGVISNAEIKGKVFYIYSPSSDRGKVK